MASTAFVLPFESPTESSIGAYADINDPYFVVYGSLDEVGRDSAAKISIESGAVDSSPIFAEPCGSSGYRSSTRNVMDLSGFTFKPHSPPN